MKYKVSFFIVSVAAFVLFSLLLHGSTQAHPDLQLTLDLSGHNYLPFLAKNWPPTPTPTPTPTATPVPGLARLYLCCYGNIRTEEGCKGCKGYYWTYPEGNYSWRSGLLSDDIAGTAYGFGIAASSEGSTNYEIRLYLVQDGAEQLLTTTSFTASSSEPTRYVRAVSGIDPVVRIDQDKLRLQITHVSGDVGHIYFGEPGWAWAGGSYIEFVSSQAADRLDTINTDQCMLPTIDENLESIDASSWD